MLDIAFILPPIHVVHDPLRNPPLGILYLAEQVRQAGMDMAIADLRDKAQVEPEEWLQAIPPAKCYGLTASSAEYPVALQMAMLLQLHRTGKVILGGVHATVAQGPWPYFNAVVKGEADEAIAQIVQDAADNDLRGRYDCRLPSLNDLPWPARDLLPDEHVFNEKLVRGYRSTSIMASRGCPYACAFCASPGVYARHVRLRDPRDVAQEALHLRNFHGVQGLRFHDDLLTLNKAWLLKLCESLAPLDMAWRCNARVDRLDREMLRAMKAAGCRDIGLGVESVNDATLQSIGKGQTTAQAREAIRLCREEGIASRIFLIIGLPEDFGDLSGRIIAFLEETQPDGVDLNSLVPLPGSDLYDNPQKYGMRIRQGFSLDLLGMLKGIEEEEWADDFLISYPGKMTNEELKGHRKAVLDYLEANKLEVDD